MLNSSQKSTKRRRPFDVTLLIVAFVVAIVGIVASYSLRSNVKPPPTPPPNPVGERIPPLLSTGRKYLTGAEESGYALYSYLLFKKRPASGTALKTRYLAALDSFKDLIPPVTNVEKENPKRSEINIAYTPVRRMPRDGASAAAILEEYDFDRAQTLLQRLPSLAGDGPFIVSLRSPATHNSRDASMRVRINMSGIDPRIVSAWTDLFLKEANRVNFSGADSPRRFLLNLRDLLAKAAEGLDSAKKGALWWKDTVAALTPTEAPAKPK